MEKPTKTGYAKDSAALIATRTWRQDPCHTKDSPSIGYPRGELRTPPPPTPQTIPGQNGYPYHKQHAALLAQWEDDHVGRQAAAHSGDT